MTCLREAVAERSRQNKPVLRAGRGPLLGLLATLAASTSAWSLSEFIHEDMEPLPDPEQVIEREPLPPPDYTVPLPDPIRPPLDLDDPRFETVPEELAPAIEAEPPEILYDLDRLPDAVRETRNRLMEIARSGDIEALRPLLGEGEEATLLTHGPPPEDPVDYLRSVSGDTEGHEILAILYEVLESGFVHLANGDAEEMYVWPYFYTQPLEGLDARQRVELFKLVTAGDYEDMKAYGAYIFYRTAITPDGRWAFFLAGH
jgi:hypothetical protein